MMRVFFVESDEVKEPESTMDTNHSSKEAKKSERSSDDVPKSAESSSSSLPSARTIFKAPCGCECGCHSDPWSCHCMCDGRHVQRTSVHNIR
jgi:hypothetical protein